LPNYSKTILVGHATRDPEIKYLNGGKAVGEFGIAVSEKRKGANGEWIEEVMFIDLVAWERTAEIAGEYVRKGSAVMIEGRLKLDQWETDGQKRSKHRITIDKLVLLGGKSDGEQQQERPARSAAPAAKQTPRKATTVKQEAEETF
jgi:single-strand DNA-binding protein